MIMYTETDLVGIAKRDNNPKRNYLVVNRLQGKHIPVPPHSAFEMFDMLAGRLVLRKRQPQSERGLQYSWILIIYRQPESRCRA